MGRVSDARERLLEAAISLLSKDGYGAVSVDTLCTAADVKKGSFYYFFPSKDDLVVTALANHWAVRKPVLEEVFATSRPPLERFERYFAYVVKRQKELQREHGRVIGCLFLSVGNECAGNERIAAQVQEIVSTYVRFYSAAISEANLSGALTVSHVEPRARALFAFVEGTLAQARIHNDLGLLRSLAEGGMGLLGTSSIPKRKAS